MKKPRSERLSVEGKVNQTKMRIFIFFSFFLFFAGLGNSMGVEPGLLNPEKKAWLPILVKEHEGFKFTVMFSNTATAHKLGKTADWVVVYFAKGKGENQCTVVTESRGTLKGKRVIRGREKECERHYS